MVPRRWIWGCLTVVLGLGAALDRSGAAEDRPAEPKAPVLAAGGIEGLVVTESGVPLGGAVVAAIPLGAKVSPPEPGSLPDPVPLPVDGKGTAPAVRTPEGGRVVYRPFEARTDREGRFRIQLPLGKYVIRVAAVGFRTVFYPDARTSLEADVLVLDRQSPRIELRVTLEPLGALGGTVTDEETGEPAVAGLMVAERRAGGEPFRRGGAIQADGSYLIEGLEPGFYQVQALAEGYLTSFYTGGDRDGLVTVLEGDRITGIDIEASEGLSISGHVVDVGDTPMAGATVLAWPVPGEGRSQRAETAADGSYRITGLMPGSYLVLASEPGYGHLVYDNAEGPEDATQVELSLLSEPSGIDFRLRPVGSILGRVAERTGGEPIEGALVVATPLTGGNPRHTRTAADGGYIIPDLATADYIVQVRATGYAGQYYPEALSREDAEEVRVVSEAYTTGIDLALSLLSTVSGKVTDRNGDPVSDARVVLRHSSEPILEARATVQVDTRTDLDRLLPRPGVWTGETGENGLYRIPAVPPGTYVVWMSAEGFAGRFYISEDGSDSETPEDAEAQARTAPSEIEVGVEEDVGGIDLVLQRLGIITGRVTAVDEGTMTGIQVAVVQVLFSREEPVAEDGTRPDGSTAVAPPSDAAPSGTPPPPVQRIPMGPRKGYGAEILDTEEGTYRITGLPEGRYAVRASARGYVVGWYDGADDMEGAEGLQVGLDQVLPSIDIELTRGGLISGYVMADVTGEPILRAQVTVQRIGEPGIWRAASGQFGTYEVNGLPNGRYLVRADAAGFVGEFYGDTIKPDQAAPIEIGAEKTVSDILFGLARRSPADFDGDGDVDFADMVVFLQRLMGSGKGGPERTFDLNGDGRLDFFDFLAVLQWMRGAGKIAVGPGTLVLRELEGNTEEVLAGVEVESLPAFQGYILRVTYDPTEARYEDAEASPDGLFEGGTFLVHEEEEGGLVIAGGVTEGAGREGDGPLARLRFRPVGESIGVTVKVETGVVLTEEGAFVPLHLPEPTRLEIPPQAFRLLQNVPNPFNPATTIAFELPSETPVEVSVYNLVGQKVCTLLQEVKTAGRYNVIWDGRDDMGRDVSSGVYFYRLRAEDHAMTRRMMLLR